MDITFMWVAVDLEQNLVLAINVEKEKVKNYKKL